MITSYLDEYTALYSISESWDRTFTIMSNTPLSAAFWSIEEMSGEQYMYELPELKINPEQILIGIN
jgi:hypothetical protein